MKVQTAEAVLIANLKGPRRKRVPLTTIAEAVRFLIDTKYHSAKKLAKTFLVTRQIIEAFDNINEQPPKIQKLIKEGKILLDASTKLLSIPDTARRIELAEVVAGGTAFDARYIIDYAKKHPKLSAEECKKAIAKSKGTVRDIHAVVVPLDDETFREFKSAAGANKMSLDEAAKLAIVKWVRRKRK